MPIWIFNRWNEYFNELRKERVGVVNNAVKGKTVDYSQVGGFLASLRYQDGE